jgi:WD40 repeat protein
MANFFDNKKRAPEPIVKLLNNHWLRCIFHYYTKSKDWLITAKNMNLFYFDFDKLESITKRINPDKFDENIMCFESINDEHVMVGNGKSISFLNIESGKKVGISRRDHEKLINNILYVKKRKYVLSGGDDGFIFLYKLNLKKLNLQIIQKVSPSGSTAKSFIDSLVYFEEQSMLFCTNRTKSLTIFCFNRNNLLKEKSKITELKFKVTGLYFWRKQVSLLAYSSLVPNIIILGFAGVNINN